ncbi:hypothetical protein SAMN05216404_1112 [Nitrosospira multiformis]|uniref:Transmembrane protein n=1 Tax=Nitrosospira multiformis TaxID=1231 RepID=A0A1H8LQN7_9PROT|nr:hypothetical protein [Nitrosospira multiformis]SEO07126.1 hypothetical protein SAMN05216404_1112 [Nitrosospira multiformis]
MIGTLSHYSGRSALALGVFYLLLATPIARDWLEASMSRHMLVQMPLLVVIGIIAARLVPGRMQDSLLIRLGGAWPCVIAALFASSYWMLPRALDAALTDPWAEAAKFLSLPFLVGFPLVLAWRRLTLIGRGFVWTNFFSMLAVLGWLYIVAPVRVCNSYLVNDQENAGWYMVIASVLLFFWWLGTLLVGGGVGPDKPDQSGSGRTFA